ncbi:hypothetical protein [Acinetobacter gerneri]|uniref:hypothetical protein n=1 Tax=Acinetobacter gerneri TaxID=202952 RepID=UPI0028A5DCE4|nr:hypothetical protein [Acinetobacter gerneri]
MNMLFTPTTISIRELVIAEEYVIQNDLVYFSLVHPKTDNVYVCAVVAANYKQSWTIWNNSSDPQNDVDVPYDSLEVDSNIRPIVEDCDEVDVVLGQTIELSEDQIQLLNAMLSEHFETEKRREFKGMTA